MTKNTLIDAGFLIALCDPSDDERENAIAIYDLISDHTCILPWPIHYETFRTKSYKRHDALILFNQFINYRNVEYFDDSNYRDRSLEKLIDSYHKPNKKYSLVDHVIREIIIDPNVKIDYFVTFNPKDFMDVCSMRRIEILSF
jgi:predicted nucleic acid-binding protein